MRLQTTHEGRGSQLRSLWSIALTLAFTFSLVFGGIAPARANTPGVARAPLSVAAAPLQQGTNRLYLTSLTRYSDISYSSPFGVSIYNTVDATTGLNQMQAAGAKLVFTNAKWFDIEYNKDGAYDFSSLDAKVTAVAAAGMQLVVLFDDNPTWARVDQSTPRGPVADDARDNLQRVTAALATRYNGKNGYPRIDYWLFYGEPDGIYSFGNTPELYADYLSEVSPGMKAANPNAKVMPGAVAYERFTDDEYSPGPFKRDFLPRVLARLNTKTGGAAAYIDGVGFNEFGLSPLRWPTVREKVNAVRQVLTAAGVGNLPIIVTELSRTSKGVNSEASQAQNVIKQYAYGIAARAAQMHWFLVFDKTDVPANQIDANAYGLFRGTNLNDPKPSYAAYTLVAHELDGARYVSDLNAGGAQGLVFIDGPETVTVVWATGSTANVGFSQTCARTVTRLSAAAQIQDGGAGDRDGSTNGRVTVQVTQNEPMFVRSCQ